MAWYIYCSWSFLYDFDKTKKDNFIGCACFRVMRWISLKFGYIKFNRKSLNFIVWTEIDLTCHFTITKMSELSIVFHSMFYTLNELFKLTTGFPCVIRSDYCDLFKIKH